MRIIGGKDYYDSGLAFGQDEAVRFVRTGHERMSDDEMLTILGTRSPSFAGRLIDAHRSPEDVVRRSTRDAFENEVNHSLEIRREGRVVRHDVSLAQVVLCGRLHGGMRVKACTPYGVRTELDDRWIWTRQGLDAYASQHGLSVDDGDEGDAPHLSQFYERISASRWFEPRRLEDPSLGRLVERRVVVATRAPDDRVRSDDGIRTPWRINQDTLKDLGFAKAVDPYTAFQEISMWVGGVLPHDGPQTVEIVDDVVKLQKHGFDHPTSFRRARTGPRR